MNTTDDYMQSYQSQIEKNVKMTKNSGPGALEIAQAMNASIPKGASDLQVAIAALGVAEATINETARKNMESQTQIGLSASTYLKAIENMIGHIRKMLEAARTAKAPEKEFSEQAPEYVG